VLAAEPDVTERAHARHLPSGPGTIRFDRVGFGYRPSRPLFTDLDLVVDGGTSVALVGASGAGKTTLAFLACRFYDPTAGRVFLDGAAVDELRLDELRGAVSIVFEDTVVFTASIRNNLRVDVLPVLELEFDLIANAGVQLIATMMTGGGDTSNVPDRGSTFASFFRANENSRVAGAWVQTMNSLPASEGGSCPGGGGGHGFNGCGCNLVIGMDIDAARANASLTESWVHLTQDSNDALGNRFFAARWVCNYPIKAGRAAWVLP